MKGHSAKMSSPTPVKIALLDTGLNEKYKGWVPPTNYHDFTDPSQTNYQDTTDHGTKMFRVLRRVYSNAEIYIGRVFETKEASQQTADLMEKVTTCQ